MVTSRYIETGVLITFILLIGFCTRIDPALAQAENERQTATDVEKVVDKGLIERVDSARLAAGS